MISTAENPSPFDPLADMPPDEGRFVLRERDPAAPGAITEWARIRRNLAFKKYGHRKSNKAADALKVEMLQAKEADEIALEWASREAPERIEGKNTSYQEVVKTADQLAELDAMKVRETALHHLREGAAHISDAREILSDDDFVMLDAAIIAIRGVVERVRDGGLA